MAASSHPDDTLALRFAVANLLRLAAADLADARALLRGKSSRNAAVLVKQAFMHIIKAVAASEHGWPLAEWNAGLRAVPETNPFQPDLVEIDALAREITAAAVQVDGRLSPTPDNKRTSQALSLAATTLNAVAAPFDIDMAETGPARRVDRIRPDPLPTPATPPMAAPVGRTTRSHATVRPLRPETHRPPKQARVSAVKLDAASVRLPEQQPMRSRSTTNTPPPSDADIQPVQQPSRAQHAAPEASSTAFWSLMDRWQVADQMALALLGHPGGMTKQGTRPRFRVVGSEAKLFSYLREIDAALMPLGTEPAQWIRQPIKDEPFNGATPLAHMTDNGLVGARDVIHKIMAVGLRQQS